MDFAPLGDDQIHKAGKCDCLIQVNMCPQSTCIVSLKNLNMMPIGVPKVAYRVPGAPQADWVDIYNRLYRERIIFLGQEIDDEVHLCFFFLE